MGVNILGKWSFFLRSAAQFFTTWTKSKNLLCSYPRVEIFCWLCAKTVRKEEIMISWRRKESRMFEHERKFMVARATWFSSMKLWSFLEVLVYCWKSSRLEISHSRDESNIFVCTRQDSSHHTRNCSFLPFAFSATIPAQLHLSSSAIESESLPSQPLSLLAHVIHIIFMMIRTFPLNYFYPRVRCKKSR